MLDRLANRPDTLFVYGSLTFPEVLDVLFGRTPVHASVSVTGWRVAALRDRPFPVLVPGAGRVSGIVITDLDPAEWRIVDDFEAPSYDLCRLALDGGGHGWTYVAGVSASSWGVLPHDWDRARFETEHLAGYLRRCAGWRRDRHAGTG